MNILDKNKKQCIVLVQFIKLNNKYICYIKPLFSNLCSLICSFRSLFSAFFSSRSTPSSLFLASNSSALDLSSWKVWSNLASSSSLNLVFSSSNSFLNLSLSASNSSLNLVNSTLVSLLNLFWSSAVKSSFNLFSISSLISIRRRSSIPIEFYIEKPIRMYEKYFNTNMKIKINTVKIKKFNFYWEFYLPHWFWSWHNSELLDL